MKKRMFAPSRWMSLVCGLLLLLDAPRSVMGEAPAAAVAGFNEYCRGVETRLAAQHRSAAGFVAPVASDAKGAEARMRAGELIVDQLTPAAGGELPGALLHHWRGTAFARGATAEDFERLMRDFHAYPQHFAPQVVEAKVLAQRGDDIQAWMRVRQRHVITVVMDTTYDVRFGRLDVRHGYSVSQSTRIAEIDGAGTGGEHVLSGEQEHGFLWRLNTYWSYEERDGGLYLQIEAVSLTRSIPRGLGWAMRPYLESIPRESLEFTLRSACGAVGRK